MIEKPQMDVVGDGYRLYWPTTNVEIELDRLVEARDGLSAEIMVGTSRNGSAGLFHGPVRFNLVSTQARTTLAKLLNSRVDDVDWAGALEQTCFKVIEHWRAGEPVIRLSDYVPKGGPRWVLQPYIETDEPTILFADGGSAKSCIALAMALSLSTLHPIIGKPRLPEPIPVLYLDWETNAETHYNRMQAILSYFDEKAKPPIYYRRQSASLAESIATIRKEVVRLSIGAIVVDSIGMAVDEIDGTEGTKRLYAAMRTLNRPWLAIDHVTKNGEGAKDKPYGTVFKSNWVRNAWAVEKVQEEGTNVMHVALVNKKRNNGPLLPRVCYRVGFDNSIDEEGDETLVGITFTLENVREVPEFLARCGLKQRIMVELGRGELDRRVLEARTQPKTPAEFRARLKELRDHGDIQELSDGRIRLLSNRQENC